MFTINYKTENYEITAKPCNKANASKFITWCETSNVEYIKIFNVVKHPEKSNAMIESEARELNVQNRTSKGLTILDDLMQRMNKQTQNKKVIEEVIEEVIEGPIEEVIEEVNEIVIENVIGELTEEVIEAPIEEVIEEVIEEPKANKSIFDDSDSEDEEPPKPIEKPKVNKSIFDDSDSEDEEPPKQIGRAHV